MAVAAKRNCLDSCCAHDRQVDGRGIENLSGGRQPRRCAWPVGHSRRADHDLIYYPDRGFDYVILFQTIQGHTASPKRGAGRYCSGSGEQGVVSFPNFGYLRLTHVCWLFPGAGFAGERGTSRFSWYENRPNDPYLPQIRDFMMLCDELGATVERAIAVDGDGRKKRRCHALVVLRSCSASRPVFLLRHD